MQLDVDGRSVFGHTGGVEWPAGAREGVVLIHGAGNDHSVWRYQTRLLAGMGVAVVAVDLPGHGRSAGPALTSVGLMAAWVTSVVDVLDIDQATLIGHSMGSLIALAGAAEGPGRIGRVGLIATAPRMAVHPALLGAAEACDPLAVDLIVGWSHTAACRFGGHRQAGVWTAAQTRRLLQRNLDVLGIDLAACAAYDAEPAATALDVEAIVVSGQRDRMTPAKAGAAVAQMLGAPHTVISGGSHVSLYDHPDQVNGALVPWVCGGRG